MTPETHDPSEAGFEHLRNLLPPPPTRSASHATLEENNLPGNQENANCRQAFGEEGVGRVEGVPRGRRDGRARRGQAVDTQCLADYLAKRLDDEKSLAFYQLVARRVPREVVQEALTRALDVPRKDVRRSRAALFTSIVREHLPRRALRRNA